MIVSRTTHPFMRSTLELGFALIKDDFCRRSAHASHAQRPHGHKPFKSPYTARRLYLYARRRTAPHQPQVVVRRAAVAVAGRSLHEVGADLAADSTQLFLLSIVQKAILEDHFHNR